MAVHALTPNVGLVLGDRWVIDVKVTDDAGCRVDVVPTMTVTLPNGTTSSVTPEYNRRGVYRGVVAAVASTGRYVAHASASGYGVADAVAYVASTTVEAGMPTVDDFRDYISPEVSTRTDEQIQSTLDAEASAQRAKCRVAAVYPPDLAQALMRRVQVSLAKRGLPLDREVGDAGISYTPTNDPEVRRLEGPYRKAVFA